jgi:hypothetical protein
MKTIKFLVLFAFIIVRLELPAQRGRGHHQGAGHRGYPGKVVVRQSPYRPNKIIVYHPYWRPNYAYHRRWVFFPRYNLYWDNWRNHYVFWNGGMWVSQSIAPPFIVNVNLDKEKSTELREEEDDVDDIYRSNEKHKTENQSKP